MASVELNIDVWKMILDYVSARYSTRLIGADA